MLDVGDGHQLWFEQAGQGVDALVLHGGPGSGCTPNHYDLFDLTRYRVMLLDQRGGGKSLRKAAHDLSELDHNTTVELIDDIERLRMHLGIETWVILGGSWGSTLAMAYAQTYPAHVRAMVLAGVATTAKRDVRWLYGDIGNIFPEAYDVFCAQVPEIDMDPAVTEDRVRAYAAQLRTPEHAQGAADAWCQWETAIFGGDISNPGSRYADPLFRLGFARIVTHYFSHNAWMTDNQLLKNVGQIAHIPCRMIHSRFDPSCPLRGAWDLAKFWPAAFLKIMPGTTHSALAPDMAAEIRQATDHILDDLPQK